MAMPQATSSSVASPPKDKRERERGMMMTMRVDAVDKTYMMKTAMQQSTFGERERERKTMTMMPMMNATIKN